MGQNVSGAWLSVPLTEELIAELEQYTLEASNHDQIMTVMTVMTHDSWPRHLTAFGVVRHVLV